MDINVQSSCFDDCTNRTIRLRIAQYEYKTIWINAFLIFCGFDHCNENYVEIVSRERLLSPMKICF